MNYKNTTTQTKSLNRRAFVRDSSLILLGAGIGCSNSQFLLADEAKTERQLRVGIVTDLHYADKPASGTRYYRETPRKLEEAANRFSDDKLAFLVELGDFVDAADSVDKEMGYLKKINQPFSAICKNRHYVLGNHCVHTLTKEEFLGEVEQPKSYYSFDFGDYHFVVLDSCFRSDGVPYGRKNFAWTDPNIPAAELEWLKGDLAATAKKTVIFAHQRFDIDNYYGVKNGADVRQIFESSGKVLAVFQGHSHKNNYTAIAGIHYCTMVAMVEGSGPTDNGFSTMDFYRDGSIRIDGFFHQENYHWHR